MKKMLDIDGGELPTGRRRILPGGKLTPEKRNLIDLSAPEKPPADKKELGVLQAEESPQKKREVKRRVLPDGVFEIFEGALIINKKPNERLTVAQVESALCKANGYSSIAGRLLNCSSECIRNYTRKYPRLQRLQESFLDARLDITERNLDIHCQIGNLDAIKFMLDRRGQHRGYGKDKATGPKIVKITVVPAPENKMIRYESENDNVVDMIPEKINADSYAAEQA